MKGADDTVRMVKSQLIQMRSGAIGASGASESRGSRPSLTPSRSRRNNRALTGSADQGKRGEWTRVRLNEAKIARGHETAIRSALYSSPCFSGALRASCSAGFAEGKAMRSIIETNVRLSRLWILIIGLVSIAGTLHAALAQGDQHDAPTAEPLHVAGKLTSTELLAAADRLYLRFMGYPELTGEYRVGADQSISIPVLGRIRIADINSAQLEQALAAKIAKITKKDGYVTVEISAYKPVFVTGTVKHPGAIEWRPGMTVIQAIALAGGVGAEMGAIGEADAGGPSLALEKDIDNQKRVLADIARLTAEREGSQQIATPQRLISLVGAAEAGRLISHEEDILKRNRDILASKLAILEQGISDSQSMVSALRQQSINITQELQVRRDYIRRLGSVRPDEEQLKLSDLEERLSNVQANIAKSSASSAELQLSAVGLKKDRDSAIETELDRLDKEYVQLKMSIDALQGLNGSLENKTKSLQYQIVRSGNDGPVRITAEEMTSLKPGDALTVALP